MSMAKLGLGGSFWLHGFSAIQVRKFWVELDPMGWELVNRRRYHKTLNPLGQRTAAQSRTSTGSTS